MVARRRGFKEDEIFNEIEESSFPVEELSVVEQEPVVQIEKTEVEPIVFEIPAEKPKFEIRRRNIPRFSV